MIFNRELIVQTFAELKEEENALLKERVQLKKVMISALLPFFFSLLRSFSLLPGCISLILLLLEILDLTGISNTESNV